MPEGLFVIRVVVGLLLIGHGTQKLFGWFGGHGLAGTGGFFHSLGHRPGRLMAAVAGTSEAGGGLLLVLGLLTPLGAAIVLGTMVVAGSVHADKGVWATAGGYELPLVYGVVGAGLAFTGAGGWSIDSAADIPYTHGWVPGLLAVIIGLAAAAATTVRRNRTLAAESEAYPAEAKVSARTGAGGRP
jgi:putative oxidoreductase